VTEPQGARQLPLFPPRGAPPQAPRPLAPAPAVTADSSLGAAMGAFDDHLARAGKTENTRQAFASDLRLLARFLGAGRPVREISTDDLNRFLTWMLEYRERPCRAKTYARRVTTLKVFFAWLCEAGARAQDPAAALVHRRADAPLPRVLSETQVAALLAAAARPGAEGDPRPELLVRLLLDTGLKKGELARLTEADLDTVSRPPTLLVRYEQTRWRQKQRRVSFGADTLGALTIYLERYDPDDRLFECTPRNLEYVLADVAAAAGLPEGTGFETLRWTSAVRAHRAGIDPETLRERLGLSPVTWAETARKLELLAAPGPAPSQAADPAG